MADNSFILYHHWCLSSRESAVRGKIVGAGRGRPTRNSRDRSLAQCLPTLPYPRITWGSLKLNTCACLPRTVVPLVEGMVRMGPGIGFFQLPQWSWCAALVGNPCAVRWELFLLGAPERPVGASLHDSQAASAGWLGNSGSYVQITENGAHCSNSVWLEHGGCVKLCLCP